MAAGVDTSAPITTSEATCIKNAGKTFVIRYYRGNGTTQLTQAEAEAISKAGLKIGVVFEDNPTSTSYFTAAQGTADGRAAVFDAMDVGQPADSAIYFSVDYDATAMDASGPIKTYFEAVKSEFEYMIANFGAPPYLIGVYGDGAVCSEIKDSSGLAQYSWLGAATSYYGSSVYTNWNLKQGAATTICNVGVDLDDSSGAFGGFTV